jgi:hypothetical protein
MVFFNMHAYSIYSAWHGPYVVEVDFQCDQIKAGQL